MSFKKRKLRNRINLSMIKKTNTSIYLYSFYSNWEKADKDCIQKVVFDNFYLGDMEYRHYNYFIDFDYFQKDNIIFGLMSEDKNKDFEELIEKLNDSKMTVTSYDCTHYMLNPDTDELLIDGVRKRMFVFKIKGIFIRALQAFKLSKYSLMYSKEDLDILYSTHIGYLMKYIKEDKEILINLKNYKDIFSTLNLEQDLDYIKMSYYHILRKSSDLKTLIDKLFLINYPDDKELKSKLKYEEEIYNYEKVMEQDLRLEQTHK
jgi:hypothetical protein